MNNKSPLIVLSLLVLTLVPLVSASAFFQKEIGTLNLFEKNPTDWSVVHNGAYGVVKFDSISILPSWKIVEQRIRVSAYNLEPRTAYQLIYYGNSEFNDVWPYATCIGTPTNTSTQGFLSTYSTSFDYLTMKNDNLNQKIWVVLASDVDCSQGKMTAWNPTQYLFEEKVI